ncbi:hypothetical protein RUND412_005283 [Rhizina undulata]
MDADWESLTPFTPFVSKEYQFAVAFVLMATGFLLTGFFSLSMSPATISGLNRIALNCARGEEKTDEVWGAVDKSVTTAPLLAIPASLSLGYGPPLRNFAI